MIAMALACDPKILIADEPTTALDVTIQAQILALLAQLQENSNTTIILITHNLGVVAEMADQVAVMYAGNIVEHSDVAPFVRRSPGIPIPRAYWGRRRIWDAPDASEERRLTEISGMVPPLDQTAHRLRLCIALPACD